MSVPGSDKEPGTLDPWDSFTIGLAKISAKVGVLLSDR